MLINDEPSRKNRPRKEPVEKLGKVVAKKGETRKKKTWKRDLGTRSVRLDLESIPGGGREPNPNCNDDYKA